MLLHATPPSSSAAAAPRVSVVVPTYNRAADIGRCLDSLIRQTYRDFEVVICDDGSTDRTREVAESYSDRLDIAYHWAENFGGPARPRNAGLRLARGAYIAFLDSDDWWCSEKLAVSVACLDEGADLVYHDLYAVRSTRQRARWAKKRTFSLKPPIYADLLRKGNVVPNSSVVVRAEILRGVGGFSEDRGLIAWEDYDAWLRIARVTDRFERISRPLGYYWMGGGNISSAARTLSILERFRELYAPTPGSPPGWYYYSLGLAHYDLGSYSLALCNMREAVRSGLPAGQFAKALLKLVLSAGHIAACSRRFAA